MTFPNTIAAIARRLEPPKFPEISDQLSALIKNNPVLTAILALHFIWFNFIIWQGGGVPYVMDNNESFSSLNHAHNLWSFDFFRSFGLTDEAVSPSGAAHPVVHSHQGNFPRLFSFLIYVLGARSVEAQIWLTTMTVGTFTIALVYNFFRRLAGQLFAAIVVLFLSSDYLGFAQWHVDTYRVWHCFLLFAALNCVHGFSRWPRRYWIAGNFLTYAALFYWELVFAAFVTLTVGLYTLWIYRKQPLAVVFIATVQAAGMLFALSVLVLQLSLYLGWNDFVRDIQYTFVARNFAADQAALLAMLREFYGAKNIAFFYNLQDPSSSSLIHFLRSNFVYLLEVKTPIISLIGIASCTAALLSDSRPPRPTDFHNASPDVAQFNAIILSPSVLLLGFSLLAGNGTLGQRTTGVLLDRPIELLIFAAICGGLSIVAAFGLIAAARTLSPSGTPPSVSRGARASIFLGSLGLVIGLQGEFYDQSASELWLNNLTLFSRPAASLLVAALALFGALLILNGRRALMGKWHDAPRQIAPFLLSGLLAYVIVQKISGGYIFSGYLVRLAPFFIFHFDTVLALGVFALVVSAFTLLTGAVPNPRRIQQQLIGVAPAVVAAATAVAWTYVQTSYFRLVPPNQIAFIEQLRTPVADSTGIISNQYAVPFGLVANTWAYIADPRQVADYIRAPTISSLDYLWLADRQHNAEYLHPGRFVCFHPLANWWQITALVRPEPRTETCSSMPFVKQALGRADRTNSPSARLIASDPINDRWAILQLDWTAPRTIQQSNVIYSPE